MKYFQTQNTNFGLHRKALEWKMLVYFMAIWIISQPFGMSKGHLVHFGVIWYIFSQLYQEKSGIPAVQAVFFGGIFPPCCSFAMGKKYLHANNLHRASSLY
jgi:hypothetical protein